jgi:hypothetical protein
MKQEHTSEKTALKQVPALFKVPGRFFHGTVNLDIGGGQYEDTTNYLAELGVRNLVWDPYNRTVNENLQTLATLLGMGTVDSVTCANTLNVVKEDHLRSDIIRMAKQFLRVAEHWEIRCQAYFQIYEGNKSGIGRQTSKGWQNNWRTATYIPAIKDIFDEPDQVKQSGNLLIVVR